jgi:F-type H+-transporting ATPase subunit a
MRKLYFSNIVAFLFLFATSVFAQSEHHSATSATADSTVAVHGVEATAEHAPGAEAHAEGKVDLGHMIMHHIADDHKWEFAHGIGVHLPVIAYTKDGVKVFSSAKLEDEHGISSSL